MATDPRLLAHKKAQRDAMRALTAEIGGSTPRAGSADRLDSWLATLVAGKVEKDGKTKIMSVADTARLILKVCKVDPSRVPTEARTRFPWAAVSRETLAAIAAADRVEMSAFLTGLGIAPEAAPAAASEPEVPEAAPEPEAAASEPESAPIPIAAGRGGRRR